jgi:hypothetical protein
MNNAKIINHREMIVPFPLIPAFSLREKENCYRVLKYPEIGLPEGATEKTSSIATYPLSQGERARVRGKGDYHA